MVVKDLLLHAKEERTITTIIYTKLGKVHVKLSDIDDFIASNGLNDEEVKEFWIGVNVDRIHETVLKIVPIGVNILESIE